MGSRFTPNCKLLTSKLPFVRIPILLKTQNFEKVVKWSPFSVFLEEVLGFGVLNFSSHRTPICSRIISKRFSIQTPICSNSHLFANVLYIGVARVARSGWFPVIAKIMEFDEFVWKNHQKPGEITFPTIIENLCLNNTTIVIFTQNMFWWFFPRILNTHTDHRLS